MIAAPIPKPTPRPVLPPGFRPGGTFAVGVDVAEALGEAVGAEATVADWVGASVEDSRFGDSCAMDMLVEDPPLESGVEYARKCIVRAQLRHCSWKYSTVVEIDFHSALSLMAASQVIGKWTHCSIFADCDIAVSKMVEIWSGIIPSLIRSKLVFVPTFFELNGFASGNKD